jgi:L-alanine-DL-glutamate epimerase-like enolase superfamily enzyme
LIGWGEAFGFRAVASVKLAIDQLIAPLCIGKDATRIEPLMLDAQNRHCPVGYRRQGRQHAPSALPARKLVLISN